MHEYCFDYKQLIISEMWKKILLSQKIQVCDNKSIKILLHFLIFFQMIKQDYFLHDYHL